MKNVFVLCFVLLSVLGFSQDRKEMGQNFVKAMFSEKEAEKAYTMFDGTIKDQLPLTDFKTVGSEIMGQVGPFKKILEVNSEEDTYYFYSEFEKSSLDVQITFNGENKIVGFYFVPHKEFAAEPKK